MPKRTVPSAYFGASGRRRTSSGTHLVSVRLPEELVQRLAEVGNEEGLSLSDTIRLVLERGLTRERRRRRKP